MNLSIYIKLWIATTFNKVKIRPKYKNLEYMMDNKFVNPTVNGSVNVGGWPMHTYSDWYTITSTGKKAMWDNGNLLVTRILSLLALLISIGSLLINYFY
ncbi:hypothetical protein [Sporosarcina psychrophila]|uniref:Uncharacterized protein n=1 Tax=Sporosarcina psychrophila TaxID=1476 RepID=A0ABV2KDD8_SPOPS